MPVQTREAIKVIADVLAEDMDLTNEGPNSQIMLTNTRFAIPSSNGLYIALSYLGGKPVGNNNYGTSIIPGLEEVQELVMRYEIQIDIMSFDSSARTRKEEVYQALRSIAGEQIMEQYNVQIARMAAGFIDVSSLEESKYLNRYTMTIAVTALIRRTKDAEYYDDFNDPEVHLNA